MVRADVGGEWTQIYFQICAAEKSKSIKDFASVRDRLLKKGIVFAGMISCFCERLELSGYSAEHLKGVQWSQFRSLALEAKMRESNNCDQRMACWRSDQRLREVKYILDRWPREVLRHYRWDTSAQSTIQELKQCAKIFPNFENDFVPVANFILLINHCAAIRRPQYERSIGFNYSKRLRCADLKLIGKLRASAVPILWNGENVTLAAALASQQVIHAWTSSNDGSLQVGNGLLNECQPDGAWRLFLLKKDKYGLLKADKRLPYSNKSSSS